VTATNGHYDLNTPKLPYDHSTLEKTPHLKVQNWNTREQKAIVAIVYNLQ
jgi:hypothetical protein